MTCSACHFVHQFIFNAALTADHVLNFILLGDPNETVSARLGRARDAGSRWGGRMCAFLSFFAGQDHCKAALDATLPSIGRELWNWNRNTLTPDGVNEVRNVDLHNED